VTLALALPVSLTLALALPVSLTLALALAVSLTLTLAALVVGVDPLDDVAAPVSLLPLLDPPLLASPQPSSPSTSTHPARRSTTMTRHATVRPPA
jgi:hypothetical protein